MKEVLKDWKCDKFVSDDCIDLLNKMFDIEKNRIKINDILDHKYVKNIKCYGDEIKSKNKIVNKIIKKKIFIRNNRMVKNNDKRNE